MKRISLIISFLALSLTQTFAQTEEYTKIMEEVVTNIQSAQFGTDLTPYANQMERIASAEPKEWLPNYWAAYCYLTKSFVEQNTEKRDILLDKADALIANASKISDNNDEIETLKAHLASARMAIDPQSRWQKYVPLVGQALNKAKSLNAENPRISLLESQSVFFTPEAFGGGKAKALPMIKTTLEKFAKFKPTSSIMPNWGESTAQYFLGEAEK